MPGFLSDFANPVAAEVRRRRLEGRARPLVRGYGVLKRLSI